MKFIIYILLIFIVFIIYIDGAARFDAWEEVCINDSKIKKYTQQGFLRYSKGTNELLELRRIIDAQKKTGLDIRYRINFLVRKKNCQIGNGCTRRLRVRTIEDANGRLLSMEVILKSSNQPVSQK
uniref:Cystatin domain-containing protein n=1 Tax=Strongyloides stercoralis TaxID=6248 RepID=A0A0K0E2Y4_STRER